MGHSVCNTGRKFETAADRAFNSDTQSAGYKHAFILQVPLNSTYNN